MRWVRLLARLLAVLVLLVAGGLVYRAVDVWRGPPLQAWHRFHPPELTAAEIDATDWRGYLAAEERVFSSVRANVTETLPQAERTPFNRFFSGARTYPPRFASDWNRSFTLMPAEPPAGVAVLVHGLTDSPYSLRHFTQLYVARGFAVVGLRVPGHGTVPGSLVKIDWPDWSAAVRLAMREARRIAGAGKPVHLMGYSNGAALSLIHTLDAIAAPELVRPDQLVLVSPMIAVNPFARIAELAAIPALVPGLEGAAWLNLLPEYNPFKYNSFPAHAAAQSYVVTQALQQRLNSLADRLGEMPPVLTFQSVVDETVSPGAVVSGLHARLAQGRSELVLFDVNRGDLDFLLTASAKGALAGILPAPPHRFRSVVVQPPQSGETGAMAVIVEAGQTSTTRVPLGISYPASVYSLSHVAMPFPVSDGLYGLAPDSADDFGIRIGTIAARAELGTLTVSQASLMRISSNPFLPYMLSRIGETLPPAR